MNDWNMLTLVGQDKPGIVAGITTALYQAGAQLGEASMMRLGGNFTIMLMVTSEHTIPELNNIIGPVAARMQLSAHFQPIVASLHHHQAPDSHISVYGADRPGIVSTTTTCLLEAGFNIMDLESDVAGTEAEPIYIMHIEGIATGGQQALEQAIEKIKQDGINVELTPIDIMIG